MYVQLLEVIQRLPQDSRVQESEGNVIIDPHKGSSQEESGVLLKSIRRKIGSYDFAAQSECRADCR